MAVKETCLVGIKAPSGNVVKAFDVNIKGNDVYVNYSDSSVAAAHGSYHASGQQHIKIGRNYVEWTGGPSGQMEPMKLFRTPPSDVTSREDFFPIGWEIRKLASVLPGLNSQPDMLVDVSGEDGDSILGLYLSVLGKGVGSRSSISGYRVLRSHKFGDAVEVEIDAFIVPK